MPDPDDRLERLFGEASDLPAPERAGFLDRACGSDDRLKARLERLLRSSDRADAEGFLAPQAGSRLPPGTRVGHYKLLREIGSGSTGTVYEARHDEMHTRCAVKVLHPSHARSAQVRGRFRRELSAVGAVRHPNVVAGLDASTSGEHCYLVTEYLAGASLRDALGVASPFPVGVACEIARQVACGLSALAGCGLVHRDLSPSNVFLTTDGSVKLLDFGLVRVLTPGPRPEQWLTEPGSPLGNPAYTAPEQHRLSAEADARSDLYSLGCVLYQMLAGFVPFGDRGDLRREEFPPKHAAETPTPVATLRPGIDPALADLVAALLAKRPGDRPQTPAAVAAALQPFADEPGFRAFARTLATPVHPAGEPSTLTPDLRRRSRRWLLLLVPILLVVAFGVASVVPPSSAPTGTAENPSPQSDPAEITNSIGMRLRRLPAGEFVMGSPPGEWARMDRGGVETQRRVVVPRPAYAGVFEVTQGEYRTVTGINPSHFGPTGLGAGPVAAFPWDRLPVDSVSWFDATEFCRKLAARPEERAAGRAYRLPSEEEWEYACRAGTTTAFHFGDSLSSLQANIHPDPIYPGVQQAGSSRGHPLPVGTFPANAFGLHDPHGNVMEWTATVVPNAHDRRLIRGGHGLLAARDCRSAARASHADDGGIALGADAGAAGPQYGFRVWCDLEARE